MKVTKVFLGVDAADFDALSDWWTRLIGRSWDNEPMPSCREWEIDTNVLFQVRDNPGQRGAATITLHVPDLDPVRARLVYAGIDIPEPVKVEGFETLRYAEFADPEGNTVGLLDGA